MYLYVLLGLGIAAFVAGLWCFMCWADVALNGWDALAERFGYAGKFRGRMYRSQKRGPSRWAPLYDNPFEIGTLSMGMSDEGLYLVPMVPFRLFHKSLLIPWSEMKAETYRKFVSGYRVTLRSVPDVSLYFYGGQFRDAATYLKDLRSL
jgi:hypothetical protein